MKVIFGIFPSENDFGAAIISHADEKKYIDSYDAYSVSDPASINFVCDEINSRSESKFGIGIDKILISQTGGDAASKVRVAFSLWAKKNDIPCEKLRASKINAFLQTYEPRLDIRSSELCRLWVNDQGMEIPKEKASAAAACLVALYNPVDEPVSEPKSEPISDNSIILTPLPSNAYHDAVVCEDTRMPDEICLDDVWHEVLQHASN